MGRRKTKLALEPIPDEKSRKVTFRKRKNGLFKKAYELTTLCDVKVCTIVYEKKVEGKSAPPLTFPENADDVNAIIDKYKSNSSKIKKVQNLADFYATQTVQVKKEIVKLRNKSYEDKYPTWDDRLNEFSADQMLDLLYNLENKIVAAQKVHHMMMESKQRVIQETIPPTAILQSNQEYSHMLGLYDQSPSNNGSMMMNDWTRSTSTLGNSNSIQYNSNTSNYKGATTSMWDYDDLFNNNLPLQYGTMDEKVASAFYNPMQPYMYDSIFPSAATSQELVASSVQQPLEAPPLSVAYDEPIYAPTMQPSYMNCPESSAHASSSSEYDKKQVVAARLAWVPPPQDYLKLNVNGSKQRLDSGLGAGGVMRDCNGSWVGGFIAHIGCGDVIQAELCALYYGLNLAFDHRVSKLLVEVDCGSTLNLIQGEVSPSHPLLGLISDCRRLIQAMNCSVALVCQERNTVADGLAKLGVTTADYQFLSEPPPSILELLRDDIVARTAC